MKSTANQSATVVNATLVALSTIQPTSFNPRRTFKDEGLNELADSIRQQGVIQPIAVRPIADTDRYEIIYGERRYRASLIAKQETIPAVIYDVDEAVAEEMAIAENLQRENIAPTEEANAFQRLIDTGRHDVQSLSAQFGKSEAYIRTRLKFSTLIPEIAQMLDADELTISVASEICRYPADVQLEIYTAHFEDDNYNSWRGLKAAELAQRIENEYTTNLCRYKFDKSACVLCPHNTCNLLLFTEDEDEGRCANRQCLTEKHNDYIFKTVLELINQHPTAVLLQGEYSNNDAVANRLTEMGYEIAEISTYPYRYPVEPTVPTEFEYPTPIQYSDAMEKYENALTRYKADIEKVNSRLEAGELSLHVFFNRYKVYLGCMDCNTKSNHKGESTLQAEIAKLEAKDKRNKEIAMERTIEDVKKQILKTDVTESKFSQDEEKMIYFFLLSSLRREHYEAVGLTDRKQPYCNLTESDKLKIIENLNVKTKAIIRRDYLIENFKSAFRDTAVADFLLAFSKKHMPEELANIEAEYTEVYEKRHQRITERIAGYKEQIDKENDMSTSPEPASPTEEPAA